MTISYQGNKWFNNGVRVTLFRAWQLRHRADESAKTELFHLDMMLARSRSLGRCVPEGDFRLITVPGAPALLPFQHVPHYYSQFVGDFIIADDPGTGKTLEALSVVTRDKSESLLVICPAHKREDWAAEIERSTRLPAEPHILYGDRDVGGRPKVLTCSWNNLDDDRIADWIMALRFDHVILDEIHHAKNIVAPRTRKALTIAAKRVKRFLGLSGTFPPNYPSELFPTCKTIARRNNWSRAAFLDKYCHVARYKVHRKNARGALVETGEKRSYVVGGKNLDELQWKLRTQMMVRRTMSECFPQMPPPILKIQILTVHRNLQLLHEQERAFEHEYLTESGAVKKLPVGDYAELRNKIAEMKAPFVIEWAKGILDTEHKLLILGHHRIMVEILAKGLKDFGVVKIIGGIGAKKKHELKEKFQTDDATRVCVGNIQACGEAIDLFAASYGIFAEASWSPGDNEQGIGRLRRYGQVRQVRWDFLTVQDSLDAKVLKRAMTKAAGLELVKDATIEGELRWLSV